MTDTCGCYVNFETVSSEEFCKYLTRKKFTKDVVQLFHEQRICGSAFLNMREEDIADMVPRVGDRIMIRNLLCHVKI